MRIGGFVPVSLCDYPCRVAAVVFAQGCNFRCPWCHNGHLVPAEAPTGLEEAAVLGRLRERRDRLGGVVVSGGEPTLQPDLPEFLLRLRDLGLAVKLDTNGSRPDVLELLLAERLVDYVAMDLKAPWEKYDRLTGGARDLVLLRRSVRLIAASGLPHEFRTTRVEALLTAADCAAVAGLVPPGSVHKWQRFRPEHSLDPALRAPSAAMEDGARSPPRSTTCSTG